MTEILDLEQNPNPDEQAQDAPGVVIVAIPSITDPVRQYTPENDLHVTLCYLGTMNQGIELLMQSLQADVNHVADATAPFDAEVSGRGRLGEDDAAVLFLESEELTELHDAVLAQPCISSVLALSDEEYPTWIPHMTLGYGPEFLIENLTAGEIESITFDAIGLWAGDYQATFTLTGGVDIPDDISSLFDVDAVTMVDMDEDYELTAAGKFDPSLHPRGADGQFIAKFGIIKWLKNGHWRYGRVDGIEKNKSGSGIDITATPSDLGGKPTGEPSQILKPSQIYEAPVKVAHLPVSAPGVKKIGGQAGSNEGGLYTIPQAKESPLQSMLQQGLNPQQLSDIAQGKEVTTPDKKFYVKKAKTPDHGRNEELANTLYADAGVMVPAVDYNPVDNNIYSPITDGVHDMPDRLHDKEWLDKVRANFVVDAWLSNRDVFGLTYDNMLTDEHGTPVRIDNGGALLFRAMGEKKTDFGSAVTELDIFRTGKKAKVFGAGMTKDQELDGAERVLAITPEQIDDRVAQAGLPKSLADTLKARRAYIADYYGLPLPESIKPADTDQIATTAPLLDPADVSAGKGKGRNWMPMSLTSAAFIANTGDKIEFPDNSQSTVGVGVDNSLLSLVGQQSQFLTWTNQYGADAQVMVHKGAAEARPEHGADLASNQLANYRWQRGDRLVDISGNELKVLGANKKNGGILLQGVVPEGETSPPPFLYDSWAVQPTHEMFTVKRWDPPAVIDTTLDDQGNVTPAEPVVPSKPQGQAVEASAKIKDDLAVPMPTGEGAPAPAKSAAAPGSKTMVLGDGTEAHPGATVLSKFGGSYIFVKPKGPFAAVTDPNSDDPTKILTKKASTLFQPGKEKVATGELPKPTTADGTVPQIGMQAKAKDGHEGEIVMISPDGKFVFITDASGKKKRKSVGTVTITGQSETPVPEPTPEPVPAPAQTALNVMGVTDTSDAVDLVDDGEFVPIADLTLKPGDKISVDGKTWDTVTGVEYGATVVTTTDGTPEKIPDNDLNTYAVSPAAVPTPEPVHTASDFNLDLPGGYVPNEGEIVLQLTPPLPNQPEYWVGTGDGEWALLTGQGPEYDLPLNDGDIFNNPDGMPVTVVHGDTPEALKTSPTKAVDLSQVNEFAGLTSGDNLTLGDKTYTLVTPPMMQGSNGVVAAYDPDTQGVVPIYLSSFKPGENITVVGNANYGGLSSLPGGETLGEDINQVYDNAWQSPDLETLQGVSGNAAVSYLALQQGLDPNADKWLAYDPSDESFWDLSDTGGIGALKWDQSTHSWNPEPSQSVHTMQPVIKNELPPSPDTPAEPVGMPTYTYTNPTTGNVEVFTKNGPDTWEGGGSDDWTEAEMFAHFGMTPDKIEYTPVEVPQQVPGVSYGNYVPEPGDKVVALNSAFDGGEVQTYWVQKPGQDGWLGVLEGQGGKLNESHPLPDSDMQAMQELDNWTKVELYGFEGSPDTPNVNDQGALNVPPNYAADPDETIIYTSDGNWMTSSDQGETWHEINDVDGTLGNIAWTKADLDNAVEDSGMTYQTVQQGVAPDQVPTPEPTAPEPVSAPAPTTLKPPPAIDIDTLDNLPGGYQPKSGKKIRSATWGVGGNPTYWEAVSDKGAFWRQILPDGTVSDKKVGTSKLPGWGSTEIFDGNLQGLKDTKDDKLGPSGLPLSVVPHEPVDIAELPEPIQAFLAGNPGTGLTKLGSDDPDKKPGYFLTMPDGKVKGYSFNLDEITTPTGSPGNAQLLKSWNTKKDQDGGFTFIDITPEPGAAPAAPAAPPEPVPTEVNPPAVEPGTTPDLAIKIPGTTDHPATPNGVQLTPGQLVKHQTVGGINGNDYWYVEIQPGALSTATWKQINPSGELNALTYDESDFADYVNYGDTVETFKVPGEPPSEFGGYTAQPGDTVVMNSPPGGDVHYWVKPQGSETWHMLNDNGSMSTTTTTNDEAIQWGMDTPEMGTTVVYGAFEPTKPPTTPPSTSLPGAVGGTKINVDDLVTDDGSPLTFTVEGAKAGLTALGEIPEGHTLWTYDSGNYNYLVSNTGEAFYVTDHGTMVSTVLPSGSKKVKINAPTKPVLPLPDSDITGWQAAGVPDPATMVYTPTDSVIVVPKGGVWALIKNDNGNAGYYAHLTDEGTLDLSQDSKIQVGNLISVKADGTLGEPAPLNSELDLAYLGGAKLFLPPSSAPEVTATPEANVPPSTPPKWPGEKKPSAADIQAWGGPLTKDGHIPTVGMYVKRGAMTGKIVSVNKAANKATVLTSDGKKSQRQIDLLSVDTGANYQAYAPKVVPVDIPPGVPVDIDPPGEAITKTMKDGQWRPIMSGSGGLRGGEMIVTSVKTPSGKKVARVHFTLTNEQRMALKDKLAMGGEAPAAPEEKGDWVASAKMSEAVAIGDQIPMRKSSTPNPDGSDRWKVDGSVVPPTHTVTKVEDGPNGIKVVTLKHVNTGAEITSNFHPGKALDVYTWDPEKVKPKPPPPPGQFKIGALAAAQGWKITNDGGIASVTGGVKGTLDVEPGKDVPSSAAAIGWMHGKQHARKIGTDGTVVEVLGISHNIGDSANGMVTITLPDGADETALGAALESLGVPYTPVTQDNAKIAVRGMLRQLMSNNIVQSQHGGKDAKAQDPDTTNGWSDEKIWKEAATTFGVPDIGWQDVMIGTDKDTGKVEYFWSPRVRSAIEAKTKFTTNLRGFTTVTAATIKSNLLTGTANGMLKRVGGMTEKGGPGGGMSASSDTHNMAAHGSYSSMSGNTGHLPDKNDIYTTKTSNGVVYMDPMAVLGRIMDYRASGPNSDNFGAGSGKGTNSAKISLTAHQSSDYWLGGGIPPGQIGYIGINPTKKGGNGPSGAGAQEAERKKAIAELKAEGITELWGRPIEDIIRPMSEITKMKPGDIPKATFPENGRSILDLPTGYPTAPAVAGGVAA